MKIFNRHITEQIEQHILKEEMTVLTDSRQVGKTTLLKTIQQKFDGKGFTTFLEK